MRKILLVLMLGAVCAAQSPKPVAKAAIPEKTVKLTDAEAAKLWASYAKAQSIHSQAVEAEVKAKQLAQQDKDAETAHNALVKQLQDENHCASLKELPDDSIECVAK